MTVAKAFTYTFKFFVIAAIAAVIFYHVKLSPIAVSVLATQRGIVHAQVMGTGTLTAHIKTTISSKIQGRLVELKVDQNDTVKSGQLLATLDDSDLREQVAIARANLETAKAALVRVQTEDSRAKAIVARAKLDYKRFTDLEPSQAVSISDVEKRRESFQIAEAEVSRMTATIAEAQKQIIVAEETLRYQQAKLADTKIYSPFEGLIVRRDRDVGDIIVPGAGIFQLISTKEIWVSAWVDESTMTQLRSGQKASIVFRSEPQKKYIGTVVRISREVDPQTREFLVDIAIEKLPQEWAIGQRAEVFIQTGQKDDVVQIPSNLIRWRDGKAGVFILSKGKALWRDLKLGIGGGEMVEVENGLSAGDSVIVLTPANVQKIQPGRRVVVR